MKAVTKTYEEDGVRYRFNGSSLNTHINQKKYNLLNADKKTTKGAIMDEIAEKLYVSTEAVKNWLYGYNAPSELEQVKSLAEYFKTDYHQFLEMEGSMMNEKNRENVVFVGNSQVQCTKEIVREICNRIIDLVGKMDYYTYVLEPDFGDLEPDEWKPDDVYIQKTLAAYADMNGLFNLIDKNLKYALLDLPKSLYEQIHSFLWSELRDYMEMVADPSIDENFVAKHQELPDELWDELDFFLEEGYLTKLREIFHDYAVEDTPSGGTNE